MKITFAVACLLSSSKAVKLSNNGPWEWDASKTPWDRDTLPDCPSDSGRTIMDDGKTHVSKYPNVGATCKMQVGETSLIMLGEAEQEPPHGPPVDSLPHCPDFDERMTLTDGRTKAVAYPGIGYNCKADYQLQEKKQSLAQDPNWGPSVNTLEHCPDFDERFTLVDGKTRAIPYPEVGFNCTPSYQMIQRLNLQQKSDPNWGPNVNTLEHCPDFNERFTLVDGRTKAVPFPEVGFNCKADYQLMQKQEPPHGPPVDSLPHCPDFDERMTLTDGRTPAVAYPAIGYNCKADYQLAQEKKKKKAKDVTEDGTPVDKL